MLKRYANWRTIMVVIALVIAILSVIFTNRLVKIIAAEERQRISTYALAIESISQSTETGTESNLALQIITQNNSIPVILTDEKGNIIDAINVNEDREASLIMFKNMHPSIKVAITPPQFIYYGESNLLMQLRYFPLVLIAIFGIFIAIVLIAYQSANANMQNRVWIGMSKETAHQLGTPLMSLVGWVAYLRDQGQTMVADDMQKDIDRLQLIAERFSKIGSTPQLEQAYLVERLETVIDYMRKRCPKQVEIIFNGEAFKDLMIALNAPLFDWVIENCVRNSLDAMNGRGTITITIEKLPTEIHIDLTDTGKGMPASSFKKVFKPGYTTKQRGWGLGLSLAKRIINSYHFGKIYVLKSEANRATTFRIVLKR
jgi:signal transduction histidine kinase